MTEPRAKAKDFKFSRYNIIYQQTSVFVIVMSLLPTDGQTNNKVIEVPTELGKNVLKMKI